MAASEVTRAHSLMTSVSAAVAAVVSVAAVTTY